MELNQVLNVLKNDHLTRHCAFFVLFCVISSIFISYSLSLLLFTAYIIGIFSCFILMKIRSHTNVSLNTLMKFYKGGHVVIKKSKLQRPCSVCDDSTCKRHLVNLNSNPWKGLMIDEKLNEAVEQFFEHILRDFVSSWYGNLSKDENFIDEIKYALKFSTSTLIKRILELNLAEFITKKLVPCYVRHVDDYIYIEQITKLKSARINDVIIEYLGKRLHPAATCRNNEIVYLRELTGALLPFVLPEKYQNCRNFSVLFQEIISGWVLLPLMDVLSNPDILNSLIIISSNYKSKLIKGNVRKPTEYLEIFAKTQHKKSLFYKDLNEIKDDTELFYMFMKFLKNEQKVHLLQFCLDFDEFNRKLMSPDLNGRKNLEELYEEAKILNREYVAINSPNYVECNENISKNLKDLLDNNGILSIAEIKVSGPLIEAYKEVFDNLEENWLPLFYESDEFYSYLCGAKITAQYNKSANIKSKRIYATSKLGRLKLALKNSAPVEGSIYNQTQEMPSSQPSSAIENDEIPINTCFNYNFFRDISTWDVSITSYVSLNKVIYFHIMVKRPNSLTNVSETQRVVLRKDQDFFTLKAKLCEFHGENEISDSPLPARRAGSDIGTRMDGYERFLKKLLQNVALRGSDLLYTFLTIEEDFSMYISTYCGAPVQDLGNIYQNVAQKLRKEKGQHLDHFMNVFLASAIGNDKNNGKNGTTEIGDEIESYAVQHVPPPKTYRNHVFNDNFGVNFSKLKRTSTITVAPENFIECLFYLGKNIFHVHSTVLKLFVAISSLISELIESVWNIFLLSEIKYGLSEPHLEYLVKFLHKVIFDDSTPTPNKYEMEQRKKEVEKNFENLHKKFPYRLLGKDFLNGLKHLWEISQHPHYNKQLIYQFLDIILLELYPKIKVD